MPPGAEIAEHLDAVRRRLTAAAHRAHRNPEDIHLIAVSKTFGADVYERLSTVEIELPPLRERLEDLPALTGQLVDRYYDEEVPSPARAQCSPDGGASAGHSIDSPR